MSPVTKSSGSLSGLTIGADRNWQGHININLGLPVDDADALRKQGAISKVTSIRFSTGACNFDSCSRQLEQGAR